MSPPRSLSLEEAARSYRMERLWAFWSYAEGRAKDTIEALLAELAHDEAWTEEHETQFLACASTTWPARQATREYAEEHPELIWNELLKCALPTTQILLKRLQEREETSSLERILRSPLAEFALHDEQREEIRLLEPWLEIQIWLTQQKSLTSLLKDWTIKRDKKAELLPGKTPSATEWSLFEREMVEG